MVNLRLLVTKALDTLLNYQVPIASVVLTIGCVQMDLLF